MLKYIVTGEKRQEPSLVVTQMDEIVSETKKKAEVTKKYMQKWDEIEHIKRDTTKEVTEKVTKQVTHQVERKAAKELINYGRSLGDSDENIKKRIADRYGFDDDMITKLFDEVDSEE